MDGELVTPEGTQEGKNTCPLLAIRLQPLPTVSPEELRGENTGPWPQTAEVHVRNDFREPRLLHLPITEKRSIP